MIGLTWRRFALIKPAKLQIKPRDSYLKSIIKTAKGRQGFTNKLFRLFTLLSFLSLREDCSCPDLLLSASGFWAT